MLIGVFWLFFFHQAPKTEWTSVRHVISNIIVPSPLFFQSTKSGYGKR